MIVLPHVEHYGAPVSPPLRRVASDGPLQPILTEVLREAGYTFSGDGAWSLWWPSRGKGIEQTLAQLEGGGADAVVAAVPGLRTLSNGRALWANLCLGLGVRAAARVMPRSYLPDLPADRAAWIAAHRPGLVWVEKDVRLQRRLGVWLVEDPSSWEPQDGDLDCRLIQTRIPDVLQVHGARHSLRVWVVIERDAAGLRANWFDDGTVSWAEPGNDSAAGWITRSGPGDGSGRPTTIRALLAGLPEQATRIVESGIVHALRACVVAALRVLKTPAPPAPRRFFELFGVDFVLDESLHPWLLEWNRRPRLTPHAPADEALRREMLRATLAMVEGKAPERLRPLGAWPLPVVATAPTSIAR